jgi:hypothetical protein
MAFYFTDVLDENTSEYLNDILQLKAEDQPFDGDYIKEQEARVSLQKSQTSQKVINIVMPLFQKAGLTVNPNNGYIFYTSHFYNSTTDIDNGYSIASEESEYWDNVNVCYIITHKNPHLKGGNMSVYENYEYPSFLHLIGYEKKEDKKEIVSLNQGSVFITKGNVYNKLHGCYGYGYFNIIKVVLYEKQRVGHRSDNDDD